MRFTTSPLAYSAPSERIYGSARFIARTRKPSLESPTRFEPTRKESGDVVI